MIREATATIAVSTILIGFVWIPIGAGATPPEESVNQLPSLEEARGRAKLLHESMHATLQVVHHEFFREEKGIPIPAATFKHVFRELAKRQQVELRWLAVNAQAMNVDHEPQNEFEKNAVRSIGSGADAYEQVESGIFRHVGAITLSSECLRCHLPNRTSTKDRAAGLIISMPIRASR